MDTTYMSQSEIDQLNSVYGEKCECCKEKFGPGELTKNEDTGEMLCEDCTYEYIENDRTGFRYDDKQDND